MLKRKGLTPWGECIADIESVNPGYLSAGDFTEIRTEKPSLLLHSCCGPCSSSVLERLADKYHITVYFYNPNITDKNEYKKRLETQINLIEKFNSAGKTMESEKGILSFDKVEFLEGEYNPESFFKAAKTLEREPEGGQRCVECFKLRLEKTAQTASLGGYQIFATTLTVSPHKNYHIITDIGLHLASEYKIEYLAMDFKKQDGFRRSIELSKQYNLYRQNYCGCIYSKEPMEEKK